MAPRRVGRALDALAGVLLVGGGGLALWTQFRMREMGAGRGLYRVAEGTAIAVSNVARVDRLRYLWYAGIAVAALGVGVAVWSYIRHVRTDHLDGQANRP